jgi:hypothetical protein
VLHIGFGFRAFSQPEPKWSASGILRGVRIQYPQLTAAKVSNPKFRGKRGNFLDISKGNSQSGMCKFESSPRSSPYHRPDTQAVRHERDCAIILISALSSERLDTLNGVFRRDSDAS